ncbi:hypothetical protein FRC14_006964 [Serendipita sp. 396]|nr:hypothetical protein FRC14_006964 [Serendipita sp. 396]
MQLITVHKLDAESTSVDTVTIFQSDSAEIVRKFSIGLKTGDNVIEIAHLPHTMDTESLRVSGIGQAILSDVVSITPKTPGSKYGSAGNSDKLVALEEEKELVNRQKQILDHQAKILVTYSQSITGESVNPDGMLEFLQNFAAAGDQNSKASVQLESRLRQLEREIEKEINDPEEEHDSSHLRNIKIKLTITAAEDHVAEISLTYLVKKASWKPLFDLRAVTDADGMPSKKLALHYRASVKQSTGEDWSDATLNLSTASPDSVGTKIPVLKGVKIIQKHYGLFGAKPGDGGGGLFGGANQSTVPSTNPFGGFSQQQQQQQLQLQLQQQQQQQQLPPPPRQWQQQQQQQQQQQYQPDTQNSVFRRVVSRNRMPEPPLPHQGGTFGATATWDAQPLGFAASDDPIIDEEEEEDAELPLIAIPSAVASKNSMAANFQVQGKANIRSDGSTHKVAIATLSLQAKVEQVVVPRSMNGAYLHCTLKNSSDTHLLPGNINIYLDDGYIANTSISHVAPGEIFRCSLGRDYSVGVTYDQKTERVHVPSTLFGASQDKMLYTVSCVVVNKKDQAIKGLVVRDVVPVADHPNIKVVLVKPAGLAEAEEGKDVSVGKGVSIRWCKSIDDKGGMKEGRVEWVVDLDARETKTLTLQWEVVTPFGVRWTYEGEQGRNTQGTRPLWGKGDA